MLFILSAVASYAGVVDQCYAAAEGDNPGLSVQVKTGATSRYSGADLDTAFDKIAQYHTASDLDVTYNSAGLAALRQAMDCIIDGDRLTLSTVVLNRLDTAFEVRTYDIREFDSSLNLVATYWFTALVTIGSNYGIQFNNGSNADCLTIQVAAFGSNDYVADIVNANKGRCDGQNCSGSCSQTSHDNCDCSNSSEMCAHISKVAGYAGGNGAIVRVVLAP